MKYLIWLLVDILSMGGNQQEVVAHRIEQYHWPQEQALEIAWCESRLSPTAYNVNSSGSIDRGVFQINDFYWEEQFPTLYKDVYEVDANVQMAYTIYLKFGFSPWVCYTE